MGKVVKQNMEAKQTLNGDKYDYLTQLYYGNDKQEENDRSQGANFSSYQNLYNYIKKDNKYFITPSELQNWLEHQDTYTKFKKTGKNPSKHGRVHVYDKNRLYDIDTGFVNKSKVATNKFILGIDVFSKEIKIYPISQLKADKVVKALDFIFTKLGHPKQSRFDRGTEFFNSKVQTYLKNKNIEVHVGHPPHKANFAERAIKSMKRIIQQLLHNKPQTASWLSVYKKAENIYNNRFHSSIGMSPREAALPENRQKVRDYMKKEEIKKLALNPKGFKYDVGQSVRVKLAKSALDKAHFQTFSNEMYQIVERYMKSNVHFYKLRQLNGGTLIDGSFKDHEITKAYQGPPDTLTIEKILKRTRRINNELHRLVKFKNIDKQSFIPVRFLTDKMNKGQDTPVQQELVMPPR